MYIRHKPNPSTSEVAEIFKELFVSIGENIKHSIPSETIELPSDVKISIRVNPVSETEVIDIMVIKICNRKFVTEKVVIL